MASLLALGAGQAMATSRLSRLIVSSRAGNMLTNARRVALALVAACAIFGLHISGAAAQIPVTVTISVDENCNGTRTFSDGSSDHLSCSMQPDPTNANLPALTYTFNTESITTGDLNVGEGPGVLSDVIRFEFDASKSIASLVFYSDISPLDSADALADTGLPLLGGLPFAFCPEVGAEGNNFCTYTPIEGQPGFVPGLVFTYVIKSDTTVPEPGSLALLAIGVGVLGLGRRRQRRLL
jgi:hypothetical protein